MTDAKWEESWKEFWSKAEGAQNDSETTTTQK
jgi:hypothetical protein